ncbi:single-stranded DNA-binding protein [Helicobacter mesocricetorum]|uniref:single-stranded DNA-binding protein n=1 Tax=Helicobacter mesocricetorum TaxID=87012 RepID=UPI000CF0672C|nr:single-stranded DNA-binding protein [Helicobacter mesocricetorum]
MFNKVILVGNLTRDVELRYLPNGSALAKLGLATNRRYKKQDGTQGEETCFIDVNLFGRTAEVANQYLKRGSQVLIEGRLVLESWMDSNGQKRSRHSITAESMQMLGRSQSPNETYGNNQEDNYTPEYTAPSNSNYTQQKPQNTTKEQEIPVIDINDEEIPF